MSYSFGVKAANKALAKEAVAHEFDRMVTVQASHSKDRNQAEAAVAAFIDLLGEDEAKDISVSVSGSLSWNGADGSTTASGVSISAYLTARP